MLALPAVFRAVYDETVHLISPTRHDAAGRAAWLRPVAELLGLRVDLLDPDDDYEHRAARYDADIICGEHAQFAFDVLRNSLARYVDDEVAATTEAAVIDRIDTVLIDEAYTYGLRAHARPGSDWAEDDVLREKISRVIDDVRSAHDETLTEWCDELTDSEDPVDGLRALVDEHIDELLRACRNRELRAGVERALAERIEQVESVFGEGAMDELIRRIVFGARSRRWGWHLTDLETACIRCWPDPPRRQAGEFRRRADERFAGLWRDLREEIIRLIYNVDLEPAPPE